MRKTVITVIACGILFASCNSKSNASSESTASPSETSTETVAVETETTEIKNKMGTIQITKTDFLTKIHNYEKDMETWKYLGDKPAIIDFYADWCGPCKQIAPILEELASEYADQIYIYKVNVDNEEELAALFQIRSIPSMLFIPMKGQPQMAAGAAPKTELKQTIDKLLLAKE